jgi:hypothetical protein
MKKKITKIIIGILALSTAFMSCSPKETEEKQVTEKTASAVQDTIVDDFDGPPFKDECLCNFKEFGSYRPNNETQHIYKSGKGWNPEFYSCSWIWGEDINNIFPEDTSVKVFKVHLLDLEEFKIPDNGTTYGNDSLKPYVIAVYTRANGKDNCVFDPFKTGKYPKPKQWVE